MTYWYSFAVSVIFSCYNGKQVQCRFIGNRIVPIVVNLRTLLIINNNLLPIEYFGNYFAYPEIFDIGHFSIAITSDFRIVIN